MLSLHLCWGASIWSCVPNPKAWSNSVSTKRQHWAGRSRGRPIGCLHVKYGRWTNQGTLAWKGGGSPSSLPPPKFNSKIPWKPWWWERKTLIALPIGLGWKVTFQGRFLLNFPGGGGVDVCKNQLMELMVRWIPVNERCGILTILWPVFVAIFLDFKRCFIFTPKLGGKFLQLTCIFSNGWLNHQLEPWKIPKEWVGSVFSWISWNFLLVWTCTWVKNFRILLKENNEQIPLVEKQHLPGDSKWAFWDG